MISFGGLLAPRRRRWRLFNAERYSGPAPPVSTAREKQWQRALSDVSSHKGRRRKGRTTGTKEAKYDGGCS